MTTTSTAGRRLRVLHVIDSLEVAGAERSLVDLLPRLADHGIDSEIACLRPGGALRDRAEAAGAVVRVVRAGTRVGRVVELRARIRARRPDLVHTTLFESDVAGRLAAAGTGTVVLSSLVNMPYEPARRADPRVPPRRLELVRRVDGVTARRLTDHFHAITHAVARAAVDRLGVAPERITVVPRGRSAQQLPAVTAARRRRARRALGIDDDAPVVVSVGRQEYQKGHLHLVRALPALVRARPDLVLLHAGRTGRVTPELEAAVREAGVGAHVRLLGVRGDVPRLLAAADVFAFPSLFEGLGGAVLEAMATGVPVVASDLPPLRETLGTDGACGVLVPAGEPAALGRALRTLLGDPTTAAAMGRRGRERFLAEYTLAATAGRMVALYRDLAADPTPVARVPTGALP